MYLESEIKKVTIAAEIVSTKNPRSTNRQEITTKFLKKIAIL